MRKVRVKKENVDAYKKLKKAKGGHLSDTSGDSTS